MIEVKMIKDFLLIKETLERIGIANRTSKIITPSCYLIYKKNKYYITHFKYILSKNKNNDLITKKDIDRQNAIVSILQNWKMINIVDENIYQNPILEKIFVLPYNQKGEYSINHKIKL